MTTSPAPVADRPPTPIPPADARRRGLLARTFLGNREDARWLRPALWALLAATAVLYLRDLSVSGYANAFYAAAVQSGTKSWAALFFGSLDPQGFITVDKPPASLWVMGLSGRLFGFSSTSLLVPQALMGVATVALTWATVRRTLVGLSRTAADAGGLVAGAVVAATPAAALMFRFDNPDALLVLLMTAGAYCTVRALPRGSWRWIALAGVAIGFAFLTKMLQGFLVLPALGLVYLLAARATWRKRLVGLAIATGSVVVSAGWWVLVVALWPADARPYVGGSTDDSVLDLAFGYNGLSRIIGGGGVGAARAEPGGDFPGFSSFGGATGLQRLFTDENALQISWLLPAALVALVVGLLVLRRRSAADPARAGLMLWGGWLLVTGVTFSFMSGTIHPYYTVALAPAIGGLVATGGVLLVAERQRLLARVGLAAMIGGTAVWTCVLLSQQGDVFPGLRWVVLGGGLLSALAVLVGGAPSRRRLVTAGALAGALFGLAGTGAFAFATTTVGHSGSTPDVGAEASASGPGHRPGGGTGRERSGSDEGGGSGDRPAALPSGGGRVTGSPELDALLQADGSRKWAAAVDGSQSAAQLELDTGTSVMAIGGWSHDPAPTLAEFQAHVAAGDIGYYIAADTGQRYGRLSTQAPESSAIRDWVTSHFTARTVGGQDVYDLGGAR